MTTSERNSYFGHLWPAACAVNGWKKSDEDRRRQVTGECMRLVRGPQTSSTTDFGRDEVTALFCYLEFLAHPDSLDHSARWLDCQKDYKAYNRARQADWHEKKLYGGSSSKLRRDRFKGAASAVGKPLDEFNPEEIRKRFITFASRHQKKQRQEGAEAPPNQAQTRPIRNVTPLPVHQDNPF